LCFAAWTLSLLGYLDQALQRIRDALTLAQELSHPHSLVWAIDFGAIVHHMRREWLQTRERAEAVIALASEQGYPLWVAAGTCFRGSALLQTGQVDEAITQIRQGLSFWQGTGAALARSYFMATLAEAYGKNGQYDEGWRMLAEALEFADTHGDRFWEAELYRLRGELLLQQTTGRKQEDQPPPEPSMLAEAEHSVRSEAAACFQQALTVARRQQAKSLELRAAISLSRLWQHQGKPDDARHLLAEIYGWFTEGFDTADLREAKAVLEELS
jgi:predicted ATPase